MNNLSEAMQSRLDAWRKKISPQDLKDHKIQKDYGDDEADWREKERLLWMQEQNSPLRRKMDGR